MFASILFLSGCGAQEESTEELEKAELIDFSTNNFSSLVYAFIEPAILLILLLWLYIVFSPQRESKKEKQRRLEIVRTKLSKTDEYSKRSTLNEEEKELEDGISQLKTYYLASTILYIAIGVFIILSVCFGLWSALNWHLDLPSLYFGEYYWKEFWLATTGGIILSVIALLPVFSRESTTYTTWTLFKRYVFSEKSDDEEKKSCLPQPAPLGWFIAWSIIKILLGMCLFSNMLVGLWFLGGNGITFLTKDGMTLYSELLVIGQAISGAIGFRVALYIIHQATGILQYFHEAYRNRSDSEEGSGWSDDKHLLKKSTDYIPLTWDQFETVIGKIMKIVGIFIIWIGLSRVFGITGQFEHLVGPYRHTLFGAMVWLGMGLAFIVQGGIYLGDNPRQKVFHATGSVIFGILTIILGLYYTPDFRVMSGLAISFIATIVVFRFTSRISASKLVYDATQAKEDARNNRGSGGNPEYSDLNIRGIQTLVASRTLAIFVTLILIMVTGSVIGGVWLKAQHVRDPVEINGDLIGMELELNVLGAGFSEFEEIKWNFATTPMVEDIAEIGSTVENYGEILENVRLWDSVHIEKRFRPAVGERWLQMGDTDIVRFVGPDEKLHLYWISPRNLNLEEIIEGSKNAWFNEHKSYTHSTGYIIADAHTGEFVPFSWGNDPIYFGEGPYRNFVYDFEGREVAGSYQGPTVNSRIPISDIFWFQEWSLVNGPLVGYMDIFERCNELFPFLQFDPDPYLCIDDNQEVWYSIDAGVSLKPTKVPLTKANYTRALIKILVNTQTGEFYIYYNDMGTLNDEIILPLIMDYYGEELVKPLSSAPSWYLRQLRYPETFMEIQIDAMNVFHTARSLYDKPRENVYVHEEDFLEVPEVEDLRHLFQPFFGNPLEFVSMITVERSGQKVPNTAGIWVTQNDMPNYGKVTLFRFPTSGTRLIGTSVVSSALDADEDVSYWRETHTGEDTGNMILYPFGSRLIFFVPHFTGQEKTVSLQKVSAVMGVEFPGEARRVGFADDSETAFTYLLEEALASIITGSDIGTHDEAMRVLSGTVTTTGETVELADIIYQLEWIRTEREDALSIGDEARAGELMEQYWNLFAQLVKLVLGDQDS